MSLLFCTEAVCVPPAKRTELVSSKGSVAGVKVPPTFLFHLPVALPEDGDMTIEPALNTV